MPDVVVGGRNGHNKPGPDLAQQADKARKSPAKIDLAKTPTGIEGFDEITMGGLPKGRATLICGGAGCGKTLFGTEFLVHGATRYNEPGVFVAFEETTRELEENTGSLGFNLRRLAAAKKLVIDHVSVDREQATETGAFDLDGLFIRLGHAIDSIGARRVVLDTLETLFAGLPNPTILRAEIRRLFRWLKARGVTAIVTAEQGDGALTRNGLEEYVSDCVVVLDHRVVDQISTRRLRVTKYRGSLHGTNEYPFLIVDSGISVMPLSALGLDHGASTDRVSTGVPALDAMFGGGGFYRGSTVLISGSAGSGKTTLAAHFAKENSRHGRRCLYFAFEESSAQITRNLQSIGLDLEPECAAGRLLFSSCRPTAHSLELHLVLMHRLIDDFRPDAVVVDPISNLTSVAPTAAVRSMLTRLIDHLKTLQVTAFFTSFTPGSAPARRDDRRRRVITRRHLDDRAGPRERRRANPRPDHSQVPRDGTLQSGPRVSHDRTRGRVDRCLPWSGRNADRSRAGGTTSPRPGRDRRCAIASSNAVAKPLTGGAAALDSQMATMREELDGEVRVLEEEIQEELFCDSIRASDRVGDGA